ncbi:hypothetical protein GOBAR_DD05110 [Gossypium barbadense]|nr:hypothetical protein GOBAR_DD05110 [Gossypium barbadense]
MDGGGRGGDDSSNGRNEQQPESSRFTWHNYSLPPPPSRTLPQSYPPPRGPLTIATDVSLSRPTSLF